MQVSSGLGVQHHTKENPFVPSTQPLESTTGTKNLKTVLNGQPVKNLKYIRIFSGLNGKLIIVKRDVLRKQFLETR
jgi:hypothetical protein